MRVPHIISFKKNKIIIAISSEYCKRIIERTYYALLYHVETRSHPRCYYKCFLIYAFDAPARNVK